jgi:RNA polymerase sigma-54 factor
MRLEQTPRPEHTLRVSARLITSSTILHLSSDELERAVTQEQIENPALEVKEQRICLFCASPLYGPICSVCNRFSTTTHPASSFGEALPPSYAEPQWAYQQQAFYDIDNYGFAESDNDDAYDPMARIPTNETLAEALLQQLEALVAPDDASIAEQLVGNLDERGYLDISLEEVARLLDVPLEHVEYVLSQLQTLEPLGIGARNLRECLLIQLETLREQDAVYPLAYTLVDRYLDQLGRNQWHDLARQLKISEQEIREAYQYIRTALHPYPAHIYHGSIPGLRLSTGTTYVRPDIIIRKGETDFEVELVEEKRYQFHIKANYSEHVDQNLPPLDNNEVQIYIHHHIERARFFTDCMLRRWRTLKRVAELVTDYQRKFLDKGVRYLRPLTRAEVANRLGLDEGTVSRATANKYALLPNGRLMPLSDFFDGSLGIKDVLRELIQNENPKRRLSDDELARLLTARGIPMARRTVTKYREEMGIGSSRER